MYYPKTLRLLAKQKDQYDEITYGTDVTGPMYVRLDAMPESTPWHNLLGGAACLFIGLSEALEKSWFSASLFGVAAVLSVYSELRVRKQWKVIDDALSEE